MWTSGRWPSASTRSPRQSSASRPRSRRAQDRQTQGGTATTATSDRRDVGGLRRRRNVDRPVSDADLAAVDAYVRAELDLEPTDVAVLGDGLNLVAAITTDEGRYVVRRPNELRDTAGFVDLRTEHAVLERLLAAGIDAPEPVALHEGSSVLDGPVLVAQYVPGEVVPLGADLPDRFRRPAARRAVANRLIDTLAAIHGIDTDPFAGVCSRRSPREMVAAVVDRFERAVAVTDDEPIGLGTVLDWLRANAPDESAVTLLHGDYRPGNVALVGDDEPRVGGVLDWETACLGDPLTDLGYFVLRWRAEPPAIDVDALADRYGDVTDVRDLHAGGYCPFAGASGSPDRATLVDRYERLTGIPATERRFHAALAAAGLAAVWADLDRHAVDRGDEVFSWRRLSRGTRRCCSGRGRA
ncbi:phosphotransferase family protein [Halobacteriales archaeon SW_7_68_16]|nr:MAG: phosphotransferase family protein [Halobacteriales archaeon SW_7_68_16]